MKIPPKTLPPAPPNRLAAALAAVVGVMLVLLPFHAFLTVWAASFAGHYTLLRLWKEFMLAGLLVGCLALVIRDRKQWRPLRRWLPGSLHHFPLFWTLKAYGALLAATGLLALARGDVSLKAFAYGLLLDGRFLVFFGLVWFISRYDDRIIRHWRPLLLVPASLVILFGLLQFSVLPADFLKHFGYGPDTIAVVQTVDQKQGYQRIQSTLRGSNPLGAYLVLVVAALGGLLPRVKQRRLWGIGLLAAACAALALTFSRSAWIGAIAALVWLVWEALGARHRPELRRVLLLAACLAVVVLGGVAYGLRSNDFFQNTFFHTDEHSRSAASSNQGHIAAARTGVSDILHKPLGGGTGTAGPASVYDNHPARIAENYFIQIGQEAGVVGLGLFVAINVLVGQRLWQRRSRLLPQVLLASLIGLSLVNLLSHAWADDTLAYIWWGLAGAALALPVASPPGDRASDNPDTTGR